MALTKYGHGYTVVAVCHFGHAAEVLNGLAQAKAASDKEFYQLRARLRCGKCGVRMPKIQVYRGLR
jgi:hypothetical protein